MVATPTLKLKRNAIVRHQSCFGEIKTPFENHESRIVGKYIDKQRNAKKIRIGTQLGIFMPLLIFLTLSHWKFFETLKYRFKSLLLSLPHNFGKLIQNSRVHLGTKAVDRSEPVRAFFDKFIQNNWNNKWSNLRVK